MRLLPCLLVVLATVCFGQELRLSNRYLEAIVDPVNGALRVTDKRTKNTWQQQPFKQALPVERATRTSDGIRLAFATFTAEVAILKSAPEISVTLSGTGPMKQLLNFPLPFVTGKGTTLVVPMNEGILYPAGDETIPQRQLVTYGGHGISMPWFGVFAEQDGAGVMAILETPDDARIDINRQGNSGLWIRPQWEASRQEFGYPRKIRYIFHENGGYVAQAKRYREYAKKAGLFKTLTEKRRELPSVDLLMGAANVWSRIPDYVATAKELKSLGMDHVLWSSGGNAQQIAAINQLGYLTGRYDIFQDVWPPEAPKQLAREGWPDDLVWLPNGEWAKGWAHHVTNPDGSQTIYDGGVISASRQVARAKERIPKDQATRAFKARFIDTTTASAFREDYNPAHPLTRSEDRKYKMELLEFVSKDMKLVTGTETGIDPSVPFVHYFEGMLSLGPYRAPDSGRDTLQYKAPTPDLLKFQVGPFYRVPLWELVYHDCVVSTWYWGDYNNKQPEIWDQRDLINILYATPPMFMFDQAGWAQHKQRFVDSYQNVCPLARKLGCDEMLSHEFVTPDHTVQRSRWSSGAEVTVNLGASEYRMPGGKTIPPMRWLESFRVVR